MDDGSFYHGTVSGFAGSGTTPEDMLTQAGSDVYRAMQAAVVVTAASAILYQSPSASSTQLATAAKGTHLSATNLYKDGSGVMWYRVKNAAGTFGYVQESQAVPYTAGGNGYEEAIVAVSSGKLRVSYSSSAALIETLPQGARVTLRSSTFTDTSGTVGNHAYDTHYTNFSPDIMDWQFLSDVYVAKSDYTSIKISYTYCHNANLAFFTGLCHPPEVLSWKELCYFQDEENNVISVKDAKK